MTPQGKNIPPRPSASARLTALGSCWTLWRNRMACCVSFPEKVDRRERRAPARTLSPRRCHAENGTHANSRNRYKRSRAPGGLAGREGVTGRRRKFGFGDVGLRVHEGLRARQDPGQPGDVTHAHFLQPLPPLIAAPDVE